MLLLPVAVNDDGRVLIVPLKRGPALRRSACEADVLPSIFNAKPQDMWMAANAEPPQKPDASP